MHCLLLVGQVRGSYVKNLYIWDRSTRFHRPIHDPSYKVQLIYPKDGAVRKFLNYNFGYVSGKDDYKLVIIILALGDLLEVHIFSLRCSSWKVVQLLTCHGRPRLVDRGHFQMERYICL